MIIKINYKQFKTYAEKHGLQKTLEYCQKKYPQLKLYDINRIWLETYYFTCVVYGETENLVIYWEPESVWT